MRRCGGEIRTVVPVFGKRGGGWEGADTGGRSWEGWKEKNRFGAEYERYVPLGGIIMMWLGFGGH